MNFREDLARKVMAGEKTVTRRLCSANPRSPWWREKCGYAEGRDYAVCPGRGKHQIGRMVIVEVRREPLREIGDEEARLEGFASQRDFDDAWIAINGGYDPRALVWRVQMRPA